MDPNKTDQELFDIFIHDYFKKRGLLRCAELFANEAHITGSIPPEFDQHPRGILSDIWSIRQQTQLTLGSSSQSQAPQIINSTRQIIQDGYSIQSITSFPSGQTLSSCDFSSDGKIVASGGNSGKPFICNMDTSTSVTASESHSSTILDVRFQPGSTIFATSSADKTIKFWDAKTPERALFDFKCDGIVRSLDFHPTERILCSSDTCDLIKVWDLNQRVIMKTFMEGGCPVRFQPGSGKLLAVANQNVVTILEFPSLAVKYRLQGGHVTYVCSLCWDITGQTIASVSEDCVCVWSLSMGGQCFFKYPSNGNNFQSVIFHPQYRNVLVVGGFQGMELLTLGYGQIHRFRASNLSFTGLAACTGVEFIALSFTSNASESVVNIWK
ncbi:WD domain, G-beta repeat protein [Medicago truncatula]|uniref:WD domain, G-beta repeat protein n=1 Tax=Medicago truncatula TaxID=3880 RepID=A0A072UMN2_MEDTR|nr:WD domain, G-beta repeat protein [Medicago truncatula]